MNMQIAVYKKTIIISARGEAGWASDVRYGEYVC